MTELVACLSSGKGTWGQVVKLINADAFDQIYLIANSYGAENFKPTENAELLEIDPGDPLATLRDEIGAFLDDLHGPEVAVNLISGSGKEHMAVLSAILQQGCGMRFVVEDDGIEEF